MPTMYAIHNTVRGRGNRTLRATTPAQRRLKVHVGAEQARLVRGRPLMITEDKLLRDLEELKKKQASGQLEVRTPDGRVIDLETLAPIPNAPPAPLPHPPLDSIANDAPAGIPMANVEGGLPPTSLPAYEPEEDGEAALTDSIEAPTLDIPAEFAEEKEEKPAQDMSRRDKKKGHR